MQHLSSDLDWLEVLELEIENRLRWFFIFQCGLTLRNEVCLQNRTIKVYFQESTYVVGVFLRQNCYWVVLFFRWWFFWWEKTNFSYRGSFVLWRERRFWICFATKVPYFLVTWMKFSGIRTIDFGYVFLNWSKEFLCSGVKFFVLVLRLSL